MESAESLRCTIPISAASEAIRGVYDVMQRIRQVGVAARRQRQMIAIIAHNETEDAEMLHEKL